MNHALAKGLLGMIDHPNEGVHSLLRKRKVVIVSVVTQRQRRSQLFSFATKARMARTAAYSVGRAIRALTPR